MSSAGQFPPTFPQAVRQSSHARRSLFLVAIGIESVFKDARGPPLRVELLSLQVGNILLLDVKLKVTGGSESHSVIVGMVSLRQAHLLFPFFTHFSPMQKDVREP